MNGFVYLYSFSQRDAAVSSAVDNSQVHPALVRRNIKCMDYLHVVLPNTVDVRLRLFAWNSQMAISPKTRLDSFNSIICFNHYTGIAGILLEYAAAARCHMETY